jgi:hypothetical protein
MRGVWEARPRLSTALGTAGCAIQADAAALAYCSSFRNRGLTFSPSTVPSTPKPRDKSLTA